MTDIVQILRTDVTDIRRAFADLYQTRAGADAGATSTAWQSLERRLLDHDRAARRLIESPLLELDDDQRRALIVRSQRLRAAIDAAGGHSVASVSWWSATNAVYDTSRNLLHPIDDAVIELIRAVLNRADREELGRQWSADAVDDT